MTLFCLGDLSTCCAKSRLRPVALCRIDDVHSYKKGSVFCIPDEAEVRRKTLGLGHLFVCCCLMPLIPLVLQKHLDSFSSHGSSITPAVPKETLTPNSTLAEPNNAGELSASRCFCRQELGFSPSGTQRQARNDGPPLTICSINYISAALTRRWLVWPPSLREKVRRGRAERARLLSTYVSLMLTEGDL